VHGNIEYGLTLLKDGDGLLTHCNAGPLATSKYGTALGRDAWRVKRGIDFKSLPARPAFAAGGEAYGLRVFRAGVDVTLISTAWPPR
jgi:methylthioribose-1-phosphate isomerase